jgi:flagellar basal body-associated protein FliL
MKNLIKILLYSLLVLLVVAISVMIYKRSNTPETEADLTEIDEIDRILADTLNPNSGNFSSEDSMIFDLTGQVASNVGKPEEINSSS